MRVRHVVFRYAAEDQPAARAAANALLETVRADPRIAHAEVWSGLPFVDSEELQPLDHVVLGAWSRDEAALAAMAKAAGDLEAAALERWDLLAEPARVQGSLDGFVPATAAPLEQSEPAFIRVQGVLRPDGIAPFAEAAPGIVRQAFAHEGYLGGVAVTDTYLETVSLSCWRSFADAADFAYGRGDHDVARQRDRAERWHDESVECIMRLRPLQSSGTLGGRDPFDSIV